QEEGQDEQYQTEAIRGYGDPNAKSTDPGIVKTNQPIRCRKVRTIVYKNNNRPHQINQHRRQCNPSRKGLAPARGNPRDYSACHQGTDECDEGHTNIPSVIIRSAPTTMPRTYHRMTPFCVIANARSAAIVTHAMPVYIPSIMSPRLARAIQVTGLTKSRSYKASNPHPACINPCSGAIFIFTISCRPGVAI